MGFTQFWQVANFASNTLPTPLASLYENLRVEFGESDAGKPWLVIDWNNFVMRFAASDAGLPDLASTFFESLFSLILTCGAKICVVRDGKFDENRLLIKLRRVYDDMITTLDPSQDTYYRSDEQLEMDDFLITSNDVVRSSVYARAWDMFQQFINTHQSSYSNDIQSENVDVICYKADQEADDAIREFCARKLSKGESVYVFSGDASLVLGVPLPQRLSIVELASLKVDIASNCVVGRAVNVGNMLHRLNLLSNMLCTIPGEVHAIHLPSILALVDSESSRNYTANQYFDPQRIVNFMKEYFAPRKRVGSRKLDLFLTATVITKAILHRMKQSTPANVYSTATMSDVLLANTAMQASFPISPGVYRRFIDEVVTFSEELVGSGRFGRAMIANFPPHRDASPGHLANFSQAVLLHSEIKSNVSRSLISSVIRVQPTSNVSVTKNSNNRYSNYNNTNKYNNNNQQQQQQRAEVRFLETQNWYPATIRILGQTASTVTYAAYYDEQYPNTPTNSYTRNTSNTMISPSSDIIPRYNQPCGLRHVMAREHTVREICHRIILSSLSCTKESSLPNKTTVQENHQLWATLQFGTWCRHETMSQDTEKLLLPMFSLMEQMQYILDNALPLIDPQEQQNADIEERNEQNDALLISFREWVHNSIHDFDGNQSTSTGKLFILL